MKKLLKKYAYKLVRQDLALPGSPLLAGLDARLEWNRDSRDISVLKGIFDRTGINSLVLAQPPEPYATILEYLCRTHPDTIHPRDCETRTFLHDIPVVRAFTTDALTDAVLKRKAAIIPGRGIISTGTVSPEQGFVFYSSVCFAAFILFFSRYLETWCQGRPSPAFQKAFAAATTHLAAPSTTPPVLMRGPFQTEEEVLRAMTEAGRAVVGYGLVDSFFGNVSYRLNNVVHISQTGSSLDELEGCIDPCPRDGSSCAGLTASSELSAHNGIYDRDDVICILHGHPKFSVIMSMVCEKRNCPHDHECHIKCQEKRLAGGMPIVPGEVGTGPTGLCNTLPPALQSHPAAIVHGHGVFATGCKDFNAAFKILLETENRCRREYFTKLDELS